MLTKREDAVRKRVIQAREDLGMDRNDVAKALSMEYQSYSHYERGRFAFTVEQLFQLARILGRPVEYFLGLDTQLTDDEGQLLVLYRAIDGQIGRQIVLATVREAARGGKPN